MPCCRSSYVQSSLGHFLSGQLQSSPRPEQPPQYAGLLQGFTDNKVTSYSFPLFIRFPRLFPSCLLSGFMKMSVVAGLISP